MGIQKSPSGNSSFSMTKIKHRPFLFYRYFILCPVRNGKKFFLDKINFKIFGHLLILPSKTMSPKKKRISRFFFEKFSSPPFISRVRISDKFSNYLSSPFIGATSSLIINGGEKLFVGILTLHLYFRYIPRNLFSQ